MKTALTLFSILILSLLSTSCDDKEIKYFFDPNSPSTNQVATTNQELETHLEYYLDMGYWEHNYYQSEEKLHYSVLIIDKDQLAFYPNEENARLLEFFESSDQSRFELYHVWEDGLVSKSLHPDFTIHWTYSLNAVTGVVLIEKDGGRVHTLISPEL